MKLEERLAFLRKFNGEWIQVTTYDGSVYGGKFNIAGDWANFDPGYDADNGKVALDIKALLDNETYTNQMPKSNREWAEREAKNYRIPLDSIQQVHCEKIPDWWK